MNFLDKIDWYFVWFISGTMIQEYYNCHIRFPRMEYWEMEKVVSRLKSEKDDAA